MPVAIQLPGYRKEESGIDKLAKAVDIAKTIYGIHTDSKLLDEKRAERADQRKKQESEDKLRGLQISEAERKAALEAEDDKPNSALLQSLQGPAKRLGITLPENATPRQARNLIELAAKARAEKTVDPYLTESRRLDLEKKKAELAGQNKNSQEFNNRYQNIMTQVEEAKKMIADKGTFEALGPHNKQLQQRIDSIAIDAAKLFDPQSVARESEVAAFRNMLFEGGTLTDSNSSATALLDNFKNVIDSRAANLAQGQQQMAGNQGSQGAMGKSAGGGALPKPKTIQQNGHTYTLNPKTGQYE